MAQPGLPQKAGDVGESDAIHRFPRPGSAVGDPQARGETVALLARRDGEVVAAIIPVTARDGYSGDIELIVGVNADGSIDEVEMTSQGAAGPLDPGPMADRPSDLRRLDPSRLGEELGAL